MAFLATLAAEIGGGIWHKLLPWCLLLVVTIGLGAGLVVRSAQLKAVEVELASVRHDDEIAKIDTQRWVMAGKQMQRIIDDQAAQLKRQAADLTYAQKIADENAQAEAGRATRLNKQLQSLKARADAHPTDIRPLGPLVIDVLNGMRRDAGGRLGSAPAAD